MMFNLVKWFRARKKTKQLLEDWMLVSTKIGTFTFTNRDNIEDDAYYYLYENGLGNRRCTIIETGLAKTHSTGKSHQVYLRTIVPWLNGKHFKEIDSYQQAKHENLVAKI